MLPRNPTFTLIPFPQAIQGAAKAQHSVVLAQASPGSCSPAELPVVGAAAIPNIPAHANILFPSIESVEVPVL
jgi:hypothetical protein